MVLGLTFVKHFNILLVLILENISCLWVCSYVLLWPKPSISTCWFRGYCTHVIFSTSFATPEIYPKSMIWWSIPIFRLIWIWTIWQLTWASSYPCHSCVSTYIHNWDFVCVCGSPVNWNRVSINFNDFMCTLASCMHAWGGTSRPSSWPFDSSLKVLHPLLYPIALTSSSFCHSMTLRLHHFEEENFTLSQWQKGNLTFTRMNHINVYLSPPWYMWNGS